MALNFSKLVYSGYNFEKKEWVSKSVPLSPVDPLKMEKASLDNCKKKLKEVEDGLKNIVKQIDLNQGVASLNFQISYDGKFTFYVPNFQSQSSANAMSKETKSSMSKKLKSMADKVQSIKFSQIELLFEGNGAVYKRPEEVELPLEKYDESKPAIEIPFIDKTEPHLKIKSTGEIDTVGLKIWEDEKYKVLKTIEKEFDRENDTIVFSGIEKDNKLKEEVPAADMVYMIDQTDEQKKESFYTTLYFGRLDKSTGSDFDDWQVAGFRYMFDTETVDGKNVLKNIFYFEEVFVPRLKYCSLPMDLTEKSWKFPWWPIPATLAGLGLAGFTIASCIKSKYHLMAYDANNSKWIEFLYLSSTQFLNTKFPVDLSERPEKRKELYAQGKYPGRGRDLNDKKLFSDYPLAKDEFPYEYGLVMNEVYSIQFAGGYVEFNHDSIPTPVPAEGEDAKLIAEYKPSFDYQDHYFFARYNEVESMKFTFHLSNFLNSGKNYKYEFDEHHDLRSIDFDRENTPVEHYIPEDSSMKQLSLKNMIVVRNIYEDPTVDDDNKVLVSTYEYDYRWFVVVSDKQIDFNTEDNKKVLLYKCLGYSMSGLSDDEKSKIEENFKTLAGNFGVKKLGEDLTFNKTELGMDKPDGKCYVDFFAMYRRTDYYTVRYQVPPTSFVDSGNATLNLDGVSGTDWGELYKSKISQEDIVVPVGYEMPQVESNGVHFTFAGKWVESKDALSYSSILNLSSDGSSSSPDSGSDSSGGSDSGESESSAVSIFDFESRPKTTKNIVLYPTYTLSFDVRFYVYDFANSVWSLYGETKSYQQGEKIKIGNFDDDDSIEKKKFSGDKTHTFATGVKEDDKEPLDESVNTPVIWCCSDSITQSSASCLDYDYKDSIDGGTVIDFRKGDVVLDTLASRNYYAVYECSGEIKVRFNVYDFKQGKWSNFGDGLSLMKGEEGWNNIAVPKESVPSGISQDGIAYSFASGKWVLVKDGEEAPGEILDEANNPDNIVDMTGETYLLDETLTGTINFYAVYHLANKVSFFVYSKEGEEYSWKQFGDSVAASVGEEVAPSEKYESTGRYVFEGFWHRFGGDEQEKEKCLNNSYKDDENAKIAISADSPYVVTESDANAESKEISFYAIYDVHQIIRFMVYNFDSDNPQWVSLGGDDNGNLFVIPGSKIDAPDTSEVKGGCRKEDGSDVGYSFISKWLKTDGKTAASEAGEPCFDNFADQTLIDFSTDQNADFETDEIVYYAVYEKTAMVKYMYYSFDIKEETGKWNGLDLGKSFFSVGDSVSPVDKDGKTMDAYLNAKYSFSNKWYRLKDDDTEDDIFANCINGSFIDLESLLDGSYEVTEADKGKVVTFCAVYEPKFTVRFMYFNFKNNNWEKLGDDAFYKNGEEIQRPSVDPASGKYEDRNLSFSLKWFKGDSETETDQFFDGLENKDDLYSFEEGGTKPTADVDNIYLYAYYVEGFSVKYCVFNVDSDVWEDLGEAKAYSKDQVLSDVDNYAPDYSFEPTIASDEMQRPLKYRFLNKWYLADSDKLDETNPRAFDTCFFIAGNKQKTIQHSGETINLDDTQHYFEAGESGNLGNVKVSRNLIFYAVYSQGLKVDVKFYAANTSEGYDEIPDDGKQYFIGDILKPSDYFSSEEKKTLTTTVSDGDNEVKNKYTFADEWKIEKSLISNSQTLKKYLDYSKNSITPDEFKDDSPVLTMEMFDAPNETRELHVYALYNLATAYNVKFFFCNVSKGVGSWSQLTNANGDVVQAGDEIKLPDTNSIKSAKNDQFKGVVGSTSITLLNKYQFADCWLMDSGAKGVDAKDLALCYNNRGRISSDKVVSTSDIASMKPSEDINFYALYNIQFYVCSVSSYTGTANTYKQPYTRGPRVVDSIKSAIGSSSIDFNYTGGAPHNVTLYVDGKAVATVESDTDYIKFEQDNLISAGNHKVVLKENRDADTLISKSNVEYSVNFTSN